MDAAQMAVRCPGAQLQGVAALAGYRFLINERGVATVVPDARRQVIGVLWMLTAAHEDTLDRYEGVASGHYRKEYVSVESAKQQSTALVYVAANETPGKPRPGYMDGILGSARDLGFPDSYIDELLASAALRPAT